MVVLRMAAQHKGEGDAFENTLKNIAAHIEEGKKHLEGARNLKGRFSESAVESARACFDHAVSAANTFVQRYQRIDPSRPRGLGSNEIDVREE